MYVVGVGLVKVASLVAQTVKCLSAVLETQVRSLGWEDPLEKGKATHSSILAWRINGLYKMVGVARGHQRADTLKSYSQKASQSNHTRTIAFSNSMKLSHAGGATQDGRVMVERPDRMWSTGEGNDKPLQYSCLENPMNSMKRQNDKIPKRNSPGH